MSPRKAPASGPRLQVRPLTPDVWPALEDLFGKAGASNGCWCMCWRLGPAYKTRPRHQNRADFRSRVLSGPPPGLLAFDGDVAAGWCQLTARRELAYLDRARLTRPVDGMQVWALSCFYIRRSHRGQGVSAALVRAAIRMARQAGAPALEAYPVDCSVRGASSNLYTGVASVFTRAGFTTLLRRSPHRPIMRCSLQRPSRAR